MAATVTPVPGCEYQIAGSAAFEHEGHVQNGVFFSQSGEAYAGRVITDGPGEYVSLAFDADDALIPAFDGWMDLIVREVAPAVAPSRAAA